MRARTIIGLLLLGLVGCNGDGEIDPQALQQPAPGEQPTQPNEPNPPTQPPTTPPTNPPTKPPTEPPATPGPVPAGIWWGETFNLSESIYTVVMPSGEFWIVYGMEGAPDWAGGVVHGTMTGDKNHAWEFGPSLYVDQGRNKRGTLEGQGTWTPKQFLNGGVVKRYTNAPLIEQPDVIDTAYHPLSDVPFNLMQAAGRFVGMWGPVVEEVTFDLASDGFVTGRTSLGCTFQGQMTPEGPVATGSITFNGPPCANLTATVKGFVGWIPEVDQLVAAGLSDNQEDVLIFMGYRAQ